MVGIGVGMKQSETMICGERREKLGWRHKLNRLVKKVITRGFGRQDEAVWVV